MNRRIFHATFFALALVVVPVFAPHVSAAAPAAKDPIVGNWQLELTGDARRTVSLLSISRDSSGALAGKWMSLYGASDLKDLRYEDNKLTFTRTATYRDQQTTSTFTGTLDKALLTGTVSSTRGDSTVKGKRMPPVSRAAGQWDLTITGNTPPAAKLTISTGEKGKLTATWQSASGADNVTDVRFKDNVLSFTRSTTVDGKTAQSGFQGTIKGHTLSATLKTPQAESAVQATRFGAPVIGSWNLEIASDSGPRTQVLTIRPDMTALYGPVLVDKVNMEGGSLTFKTSMQVEDRNIEISFTGAVDKKNLTGEITTSRGTQQVKGSRFTFAPAKKEAKPKQTFRKPDVIFVPTPQKVVDTMLQLAEIKKDDVVYDLGCGDGRIVVTAAKEYGCRGFGYDISAQRVRESLANVQKNNVANLVTIERKDIFTLDLTRADVITLYLLPSLNVKLIPQLEKCKPGTRIVSHDFDMRGVIPDKTITIEDPDDEYGDHTVYLWTTPLRKDKE